MVARNIIPSLFLSLSLLPFAACDEAEAVEDADVQQGDEAEPRELSEAEIDTLQWMREEEKLARDVYLTLSERWDSAQLVNVPKSEQSHMDAIATLLDRYDLEDPVVDDSVGAFVDPVLADLYVELTAAGAESQEAALRVGAAIEELDMVDLQHAIDGTEDPALIETYSSLLCGSRNHLRGFYGGLAQMNADYEAQYLEEAEFSAIIEGERETCA